MALLIGGGDKVAEEMKPRGSGGGDGKGGGGNMYDGASRS